jgi:hypothetical protein
LHFSFEIFVIFYPTTIQQNFSQKNYLPNGFYPNNNSQKYCIRTNDFYLML